MTTTKTALLAGLALTATIVTAATEAQARPRWGAVGLGFIAGTMIGAAAANSYAEPIVVAGPVYRCRLVDRFDRWGNYLGTRKVCDVY
jgi:zinc transporter ZupT